MISRSDAPTLSATRVLCERLLVWNSLYFQLISAFKHVFVFLLFFSDHFLISNWLLKVWHKTTWRHPCLPVCPKAITENYISSQALTRTHQWRPASLSSLGLSPSSRVNVDSRITPCTYLVCKLISDVAINKHLRWYGCIWSGISTSWSTSQATDGQQVVWYFSASLQWNLLRAHSRKHVCLCMQLSVPNMHVEVTCVGSFITAVLSLKGTSHIQLTP